MVSRQARENGRRLAGNGGFENRLLSPTRLRASLAAHGLI